MFCLKSPASRSPPSPGEVGGKVGTMTVLSPPPSPLTRVLSYSSPSHVDRSHALLHSVPPDLLKMSNSLMKSLNLSGNRLRTLPNSFYNLRRLKKLNLSENELVRLSSELELFTLLEELDLSRNILSEIPEIMKYLYNLRSLDLGCNPLTSLPSGLVLLSFFTVLSLNNTQLQDLPEDLSLLQVST